MIYLNEIKTTGRYEPSLLTYCFIGLGSEEPEFETVCRASPEEIPNLRYEKVRIM